MVDKNDSKGKAVITQEGLKRMEAQLEHYVSVRRNEIADQIAIARGFGDLSENAEYDEAKKEQAKLEEEIIRLENTIRTAVVISEEDITTEYVGVGTRVKVKDFASGDTDTYTIVGAQEANPYEGRISNESPVGSALIGSQIGDKVSVDVPVGQITLEILSIDRHL